MPWPSVRCLSLRPSSVSTCTMRLQTPLQHRAMSSLFVLPAQKDCIYKWYQQQHSNLRTIESARVPLRGWAEADPGPCAAAPASSPKSAGLCRESFRPDSADRLHQPV